ncbi:MAG: RluA family pseudouridine synthase [Spirochaetota bacterium]
MSTETPGPPILAEDDALVWVNKPPGVLSESNDTGNPALSDQVALYRAQRSGQSLRPFLGIVHRLDRPTSGCLVYAMTAAAQRDLQRQFRDRETKKVYWAVVESPPEKPEGVLEHHMLHDVGANKSRALDRKGTGTKEARLAYRLVAESDRYALLEIDLFTGRHHQIRAQLAAVGVHIKGDLKYGARRSNPGGGIHLHALSLEVTHPTSGDRVEVVAPPPKETLWCYFRETAGP